MSDPRTLALLQLATTGLRDLHMENPPASLAVADGQGGLTALLTQIVTHLRGKGIDDEGGWDMFVTEEIPVAAGGEVGVGRDEAMLSIAATGLRDLDMGYRHRDIVGLDGLDGLPNLVRALVVDLRGRGIDDEGAWNCSETEDVPVASSAPRP